MPQFFSEKEKRKAQVSGKSSCMVTLPKKWVAEMGLQQGDPLTLTRQGPSSLLISCEPTMSEREKSAASLRISQKDSMDWTFRKIISLYLLGYDQIEVKSSEGTFTNIQRTSIVSQVRRRLVGTEIISGSNDSIMLQILTGYSGVSVEHALKRMLLIISEMRRDLMSVIGALNHDLAMELIQKDDEVDRFSIYIMRQLNSSISKGSLPEGFEDAKEVISYIQLARMMERAADHVSKLAKTFAEETELVESETFSRISTMNSLASELFDGAVLSVFKRDLGSIERTIEISKAFPKLERELVEAVESGMLPKHRDLAIILHTLHRFVDIAVEIDELALDLSISRVAGRELETSSRDRVELALTQ